MSDFIELSSSDSDPEERPQNIVMDMDEVDDISDYHQDSFFGGFEETLRCRPASSLPDATQRQRLQLSGKMLLPQSVLERLSRMDVVYPLHFRVRLDDHFLPTLVDQAKRRALQRHGGTYLGVLEFNAPEGCAILPDWALRSLRRLHADLKEQRHGDDEFNNANNGKDNDAKDRKRAYLDSEQLGPYPIVKVANISLPMGSFVKFQPQQVAFLEDLTDPRAVLEHCLRSYTCMHAGDVICFEHIGKRYDLLVEQVRPDDGRRAILACETDLQVDFSPPVGYQASFSPRLHSPGSSNSATKSTIGSAPKSIVGSLEPPSSAFTQRMAARATGSFQTFSGPGQTLKPKSANGPHSDPPAVAPKSMGNQTVAPLKLPPGTMFFGSSKPEMTPSPSNSAPSSSTSSSAAASLAKTKKEERFQGPGRSLKD